MNHTARVVHPYYAEKNNGQTQFSQSSKQDVCVSQQFTRIYK